MICDDLFPPQPTTQQLKNPPQNEKQPWVGSRMNKRNHRVLSCLNALEKTNNSLKGHREKFDRLECRDRIRMLDFPTDCCDSAPFTSLLDAVERLLPFHVVYSSSLGRELESRSWNADSINSNDKSNINGTNNKNSLGHQSDTSATFLAPSLKLERELDDVLERELDDKINCKNNSHGMNDSEDCPNRNLETRETSQDVKPLRVLKSRSSNSKDEYTEEIGMGRESNDQLNRAADELEGVSSSKRRRVFDPKLMVYNNLVLDICQKVKDPEEANWRAVEMGSTNHAIHQIKAEMAALQKGLKSLTSRTASLMVMLNPEARLAIKGHSHPVNLNSNVNAGVCMGLGSGVGISRSGDVTEPSQATNSIPPLTNYKPIHISKDASYFPQGSYFPQSGSLSNSATQSSRPGGSIPGLQYSLQNRSTSGLQSESNNSLIATEQYSQQQSSQSHHVQQHHNPLHQQLSGLHQQTALLQQQSNQNQQANLQQSQQPNLQQSQQPNLQQSQQPILQQTQQSSTQQSIRQIPQSQSFQQVSPKQILQAQSNQPSQQQSNVAAQQYQNRQFTGQHQHKQALQTNPSFQQQDHIKQAQNHQQGQQSNNPQQQFNASRQQQFRPQLQQGNRQQVMPQQQKSQLTQQVTQQQSQLTQQQQVQMTQQQVQMTQQQVMQQQQNQLKQQQQVMQRQHLLQQQAIQQKALQQQQLQHYSESHHNQQISHQYPQNQQIFQQDNDQQNLLQQQQQQQLQQHYQHKQHSFQ